MKSPKKKPDNYKAQEARAIDARTAVFAELLAARWELAAHGARSINVNDADGRPLYKVRCEACPMSASLMAFIVEAVNALRERDAGSPQ